MINLGNIEISDIRLGASQVKAVYLGSYQVWGGEGPGDWLCFTAEQDGSTLRLDKVGSPAEIYLETSNDEGVTWKDYAWTENTGSEYTNLKVGEKVYFRAKTENLTIGSSSSNYYKFVMTGKISASGNIQTLLKADGSRTDAPAYCYYGMFMYCSSLTTAPKLPATTLADSCYLSMFNSCWSLTEAPALPATTLANGCYSVMFNTCRSLTSAPELPATTLANDCYNSMFLNCSNLTSIDVRFTAWDPTNATTRWVKDVAASGTFNCPEELPDTRGISNIPEGWTKSDSGYPTSNLLMHFDGIDNTGAGDASHSTDTLTWANVDGSLTGYYLKRPSTTYNTSWDSKGAVLSGEYDQAFWLTDPQGNTVNALSSVDTGSFTYALAFYYDPRTIEQWRGLIGRQGHSSSLFGYNSYAYVCTNPNPYGIKIDICFGKDGNVANQQSGKDLRSYLTENSFNTIAFAYDESADTLKSFVNGQLVDTTNLSSHPPYASNVVFVLGNGALSTGSNRACIGKIYDFMMYSEAIADTDIAKIHNWQSTRFNS